ncbi:MAG: methyltransferase domain-containing protein [Niabella sp.]|nr:methyltransferase domain-containing protein [Niabella sp.]
MDLSTRLAAIVNALPLWSGIRVLEIGCGPGAAARAIAKRIGNGYVLGIDRSARAIQQAVKGAPDEIAAGLLGFQQSTIEDFQLPAGVPPFDLAFAVRVGALDGRHPQLEPLALASIAKALTKKGRLFIDGGDPLKEWPSVPCGYPER